MTKPFGVCSPDLQHAWDLSCTGRVDAALALAQQAYENAAVRGDPAVQAWAASHLGWYCFMQGHYQEGLLHVLSACEIFKAHDDRGGESFARGTNAWLLVEIGSPHEALDEAMCALELAESMQDDRAISFASNVAGVVFWMLGQYDRALDFVSRAVGIARQIDEPIDLARWLINLGEIEAELWQTKRRETAEEATEPTGLDRAKAHGAEALQLARQAGDAWTLRLALSDLTDCHLLSGTYAEAAQLLASIETVAGGDGQRSRLLYLFTLGKVQLASGDAAGATVTLTEAVTLSDELGDLEMGVPSRERLSEAWRMVGDFGKALRWYHSFHDHYVRKTAASALIRSRVAAIQYETRQLQVSMAAERSRADTLEQMNRTLRQEATLLMHASIEDALTGLPNRRGLEQALLSLDPGTIYAVAMMDIDNFKQVNDGFSHAIGDEVLRQVAAVMKMATRDGDRLFRYGGEEFVLLVEGGDGMAAARVTRRIRQMLRNWDWSTSHPSLHVTLSIGIAHAPEAATPAEVMALADKRLYVAKENGRDRVVMRGQIMHLDGFGHILP